MQTDIRHPIGEFVVERESSVETCKTASDRIKVMSSKFKKVADILDDTQLDTPYRLGGWTIRQIIHHIADSQMNGYVRFKLALTLDNPTILPYDQDAWAALPDATNCPVDVSVDLLDSVNKRWSAALSELSEDDFARPFNHPETGPETIGTLVQLHSWHGRHHIAQIASLRERMGW
jgi:uncharacterized damage-inducible protein DinB